MDAQLPAKIQKIAGILAREETAFGRSFPAPDSSLRHSLLCNRNENSLTAMATTDLQEGSY